MDTGQISRPVSGFAPETTAAGVLARFDAEPDLLLAPILEAARPVGLITRRHLYSQLSGQFGREVWLKRPISRIMIAEPTLMRVDTPLEQIASTVAELPQETIHNGIIFVTDSGAYHGVASGFDLFKANVRVTESKNAELEKVTSLLRTERDKATAASRAKSDFLATMSHEIRTPLNGVLGMAQALALDELSAAQREKLDTIISSGETLTALLNDVLDLSKIEAGKMELAPTDGALATTLRRAVDLFRTRASEKGVHLVLETDCADIAPLRYDHVRVHQCVTNLVSNAVKFTPQGKVAIRADVQTRADGKRRVQISVQDTGIGMSRDSLDKLFNSFTQADGAITRRFGGSGLGLSITRKLARMMGGDVTVESEETIGSTFRLEFDADPASVEPKQPAAKIAASQPETRLKPGSARILLVDDNAVNRQVVKLFLAPVAPVIDEAENGQQALERMAENQYDVVLMDIHMPVMDGKEAVKRIRASQQSWRTTPIIALTADAMEGDRDNLLALGMDEYVAKPIDRRTLISKIASAISGGQSQSPEKLEVA